MNKSFYQKYRPIQLSDMVGQERVVKAISKQAEQSLFSHAYLFAGHFGAGKTTMARLLASLITCQHKKSPLQVCARCKSCLSIHDGQAVDVIEIDAATNGGVENARDIKKDAYYAPQELSHKIYVIDECHMLTTEAWNALLKVIEEPPPYITFIFCTTDHKKVPNTIRSRCRRYLFTSIPATAMAGRLMQVAKKEGFVLEDTAAQDIAVLAQGSLRDALAMLEDTSIVSNGQVAAQVVREHFGMPEKRLVYDILMNIGDRNASLVLDKVDDLLIAGTDVRSVALELSDVLRNAMILETCGANSRLLDVTNDEKEILKVFVNKVTRNGLIRIAGSFGRIDRELELNINGRWILEAALLNCIAHLSTEASKSKT